MTDQVAVDAKRILLRYGAPIAGKRGSDSRCAGLRPLSGSRRHRQSTSFAVAEVSREVTRALGIEELGVQSYVAVPLLSPYPATSSRLVLSC